MIKVKLERDEPKLQHIWHGFWLCHPQIDSFGITNKSCGQCELNSKVTVCILVLPLHVLAQIIL